MTGNVWKRPICWFKGHDWGLWYFIRNLVGARKKYRRWCRRCNELSFKVEKDRPHPNKVGRP